MLGYGISAIVPYLQLADGRFGDGLYGGVWQLGPWQLHPLSILFFLSGSAMISKTLRQDLLVLVDLFVAAQEQQLACLCGMLATETELLDAGALVVGSPLGWGDVESEFTMDELAVRGPAAVDKLAGVGDHLTGDLEALVRVEAEHLHAELERHFGHQRTDRAQPDDADPARLPVVEVERLRDARARAEVADRLHAQRRVGGRDIVTVRGSFETASVLPRLEAMPGVSVTSVEPARQPVAPPRL